MTGANMVKRQIKNNILEIYEDETLLMMISETVYDGVLLMRVLGKIRSAVAFELEDELMAAIPHFRTIRVDMSNVKYISGNALQSLLTVQRVADETNTSLIILSPSEEVKTVFDDCGFSDILEIVNTQEESS